MTCQYLDLVLAMDDLTLSTGVIHYRTFFKKFLKFAYLNPKSNHPKHVFRGLVRTECMRYIRNSLCEDDYMLYPEIVYLTFVEGWLHQRVYT